MPNRMSAPMVLGGIILLIVLIIVVISLTRNRKASSFITIPPAAIIPKLPRMTAWGPASAMVTADNRDFYESAKEIQLDPAVLRKLRGEAGSSGFSPGRLEWVRQGDPRYPFYSAPHNGQIDPPTPWGIALPENAQQLAEACRTAKHLGLTVSVRAGGHSYIGASSSGDIIVSLEKMKSIVVVDRDPQGGAQAWVEAGTRLGELYYGLFHQGPFNFPGGVCPTVGLAGFILGGGEGLLQRKFGLGCDSLLDAEMLICRDDDFALIRSVATHDPELMQALRGGGQCNFGIITRLKIRAYPMARHYAVFTIKWPLTDPGGTKWRTDPWKAFQGIAHSLDPHISCYYALYMPPQPQPLTHSMVQGQYSGDEDFSVETIGKYLGPLVGLPGAEVQVQTYQPSEYLQLPLFWAGVKTVEDMLKQCAAYGKDFPQENFQMLNDHYGVKGLIMSDAEAEYFISAIQAYFAGIPTNYPGWVGLKWDMQQGRIASPALPSVTDCTGFYATAQYMYYFWTGEGGGGGVSGAINKPAAFEDPRVVGMAQKQLDLYEKLTPVVEGSTYVNYPLSTVEHPLLTYYGRFMPLMLRLKKKYDPYGFWAQPPSHSLQTYKSLVRQDQRCGIGMPTVDTGFGICDPSGGSPVCDENADNETAGRCIARPGGLTPLITTGVSGFADWSKRRLIAL